MIEYLPEIIIMSHDVTSGRFRSDFDFKIKFSSTTVDLLDTRYYYRWYYFFLQHPPPMTLPLQSYIYCPSSSVRGHSNNDDEPADCYMRCTEARPQQVDQWV